MGSKCFENLPKNVSIMLKISFLEQNKKKTTLSSKKNFLTNFNLTAISKLAF